MPKKASALHNDNIGAKKAEQHIFGGKKISLSLSTRQTLSEKNMVAVRYLLAKPSRSERIERVSRRTLNALYGVFSLDLFCHDSFSTKHYERHSFRPKTGKIPKGLVGARGQVYQYNISPLSSTGNPVAGGHSK